MQDLDNILKALDFVVSQRMDKQTGNIEALINSKLEEKIKHKFEVTLSQLKDRYYSHIKQARKPIPIKRKVNGKIIAIKEIEQNYTRNVGYTWDKFIKAVGNIPVRQITLEIARNYIFIYFSKKQYAAALDFRILRASFNYAIQEGLIEKNPFSFKLPSVQKTFPAYISRIELEKILVHIPESFKDFYRFAFFTGLRLNEQSNLKWKHIIFEGTESITVIIGDRDQTTKSRKSRLIPICADASRILINRMPKVFSKEKYVFAKNEDADLPYSGDWISKTFKKAVKKTDVNQSIHYHSLRHSFASNLVKDGASIYHLKELLGHSSVAVTEIYSHLDVESLRATVNRFNSMAGA